MQDVVICLWGHAGIDRAAKGLFGVGRRLAENLGGKSRALVLGPADDALISAAQAAADAVVVVEDELLGEYHPENYLSALVSLCKKFSPRAVLLGNDAAGQELTPRLAHRLGGSAAGDAVDVKIADGRVLVTRGVYGGKATAVIALPRSPAVVWVRARAMAPAEVRTGGEIERIRLGLAPDARVKVLSRHVEAKEGARLEDARLIVAGVRAQKRHTENEAICRTA